MNFDIGNKASTTFIIVTVSTSSKDINRIKLSYKVGMAQMKRDIVSQRSEFLQILYFCLISGNITCFALFYAFNEHIAVFNEKLLLTKY